MSPTPSSSVRFKKSSVGTLAALCVLVSPALFAANLSWDSSGTNAASPVSGTGNWDTTAALWSNGSSDVVWNNSNNDVAVFTGTASPNTVSVTAPITVGGISWTGSAASPALSGGTITLGGGTATIFSVTNVSALVNITSVLTGNSGFTKQGAGQLTLSAVNTYTGATLMDTGSSNMRLGVTNALPTGTALTINSGSLLTQAKNQTVASLAGGTNGSIRNATTGASVFTINGSASTTFNGQIFDGGAAQSVSLVMAGSGTLSLSRSGHFTYAGSTTVSDTSTLKLTLGDLTNTSSVTVNGGTLSSGTGNRNLGVGAVLMSSGSINPGEVGTIGSFTVAATKAFTTSGGTLKFDLANTTFDKIISLGSASFGLTNTTLSLNLLSGFSYANSYAIFESFTGGSVSGLTITGYDTANYAASLNNAGVLTFSATAVPEPSTYACIGGAVALGFVVIRRRRLARP